MENMTRYQQAAAILPGPLRQAAAKLPQKQQQLAEEFRLRAGRPMTILLPEGEWATDQLVSSEDLEILVDLATQFSRYAATETIREGYLPVTGGFRVGLCGTGVMKGGEAANLRDLSSAVVRIGRERKGIAKPMLPRLLPFASTLLLSPPGGGKTTLLRDLVRCLSEAGTRVSLLDERGEVAVMYRGQPQMDVGPYTDVLDGVPKALGISMVLRAMNPQVIALDEITVAADLEAVTRAAGCGTMMLATIHASSVDELTRKPLYADLLTRRVFTRAVVIENGPTGRRYRVEELPC